MPGTEAEKLHRPVLLDEAMQFLEPGRGGLFVDATLGLGGHSEAILSASAGTTLIGIDRDPAALTLAGERLSRFGGRATLVHGSFSAIAGIVQAAGDTRPAGILADLGVSSLQFDSEDRGFSFRFDAPLDMRMDPSGGGPTAADLLAETSEEDLANIIFRYGEERASRRIARWIVQRRKEGRPVETTGDLADLVRRAVPGRPRDGIHPATRTFQALRIAVNDELGILDGFISDSVDLLQTGGVLAIITFHSLEDRIVKQAFQRLAGKCSCPPRLPQCICGAARRIEILTRKPVLPGEDEKRENPRSRSAKLRAGRKLQQ